MQVMVIGLGQFGMSLARTLAARHMQVLAVDSAEDRVQAISTQVTDAMCFDAMNQQALAAVAPERRDVCVCAMGAEAREASIVVTALLRQLGAPRVVARAADEIHERILKLVGAHEVVNPDEAFGKQLANRLVFRGLIAEVPLGGDLVLTELMPPAAIVGRSLRDLALPNRFEITVVAVRRGETAGKQTVLPNPLEPISSSDILIVVSPQGAVERFTKGLRS